MLPGRTPTKDERQWMDRITQIGCVVCLAFHNAPDSPASPHHIAGKTRPGAHLLTIPLCGRHHQQKDNQSPKRWVSLHGDGKGVFAERYLSEMDLLDITRSLVARAFGESNAA